MHGYRLTQEVKEQISDLADIKFPRLYYHLNKLSDRGLITARQEQEGNRPERTVYQLTELGEGAFADILAKSMDFQYKVEFDMDMTLFFAESHHLEALQEKLAQYREKIRKELDEKKFRLSVVKRKQSGQEGRLREMTYRHQIAHLEAEERWLDELAGVISEN